VGVVKDERGLLNIGEFARRTQVAPSALRYYDEVGILRPAQVDRWTGYRFYASEQIPMAVLIRELRALAMPIAEVRALLAGGGAEAHRQLDEHWRGVEARLVEARSRLDSTHRLIDVMEGPMTTRVTIDPAALHTAIRQVLPAAPIAPHRLPAGILLQVHGRGLRLVATDGHRLALRELVPLAVTGGDAKRVVPGPAMEELSARLAQTTGPRYDLDLEALPELGEEFPPYEKFLDSREAPLHRLAATSGAVKRRLESAESVVRLSDFDPPVLMAFDRDLLLSAVVAAPGPDLILESSGPLGPLFVRSPGDKTFTAVVMPIRLTEQAPA
jgi:DNA-binding transcriptional MerR regulator